MGLLCTLPVAAQPDTSVAGPEAVFEYVFVAPGSIGCDPGSEVGAKVSFRNARMYDRDAGVPGSRLVVVRRGLKAELVARHPSSQTIKEALVGLIDLEFDSCLSPFGDRVLHGEWVFRGNAQNRPLEGLGTLSDSGVRFDPDAWVRSRFEGSTGYRLEFSDVPAQTRDGAEDQILLNAIVEFDVSQNSEALVRRPSDG